MLHPNLSLSQSLLYLLLTRPLAHKMSYRYVLSIIVLLSSYADISDCFAQSTPITLPRFVPHAPELLSVMAATEVYLEVRS